MVDPLDGMSPAIRGVTRPLWGHTAEYLGGPLNGMRSPQGWQGLRRDENGESIRRSENMPPHYILYCCDRVCDWYYAHSSLREAGK